MIREFMVPLVTLCAMVVLGIASLDKLCLFHQTYQAMASKLESEHWLLTQCSDPHFFSKMHTHSDLCFQVENNARVGAFMLALREVTQSFLLHQFVVGLLASHQGLLSWPVLACGGALLLLAPSWLVSSSRQLLLPGPRRWPECADGHFKSA
jgi:hypothetical protein